MKKVVNESLWIDLLGLAFWIFVGLAAVGCGNIIDGKCSDVPPGKKTSCKQSLTLEELTEEFEFQTEATYE